MTYASFKKPKIAEQHEKTDVRKVMPSEKMTEDYHVVKPNNGMGKLAKKAKKKAY